MLPVDAHEDPVLPARVRPVTDLGDEVEEFVAAPAHIIMACPPRVLAAPGAPGPAA
jgi:hypothetical protein